jgi:endonuclease/exonuclease/phosphatase family metal-dependent hydrolase
LLEKNLSSVEITSGLGKLEKTWPSHHPLLSLDHMCISGDLAVEAVEVLDNELARNASDHLPYIVELRLPDLKASDN